MKPGERWRQADPEALRLEEFRRELTGVAAHLKPAVDAVLDGNMPGSVLVQAMRAQDPVPAGRPVELQPLPSGGATGWLGPESGGKVIVYCHGGGGVSGSVAGHRERMENLGRLAGMRVLAVEYRLAPEHPFPNDIDDVVSACGKLRDEGWRPRDIALAGDSHGAGVALSALLRLRDEGEPLPAAAFLACGVFDRTVVSREGFLEREVDWPLCDPILSYGPFLRWLCEVYLAGAEPSNPLASPLLADLSGLPPLLLQAGEMEVLRGQSERLAASVNAAGGEAVLQVVPEMFHNFHTYPLAAARQAGRQAASFLREQLDG